MMDERTNERTYGRVDKEISGFYFHPRGTNFSKGLPPFVHPLLRPPSHSSTKVFEEREIRRRKGEEACDNANSSVYGTVYNK